ncbi:helix-turn-helix transcriptional regulator [Rhodocyclus tenuis]|uniref:helix-turn-helix transcriptional regulator n=1 Tax=Rhodocyclus tenuis TaxID=1066 RepID=UPI001908342C|nr:AraC family transcriptional regulator [Rhodocyclus tenuis]MBK1681269.1 hypothetical protein [Rhodocyclus tenuis]
MAHSSSTNGAAGCSAPLRSQVRRWSLPALEQVHHRRPGQEWIPHWHGEWSIGAIVHGECLCSIAGGPIRAVAGDVLAIAPQTVHTGALTPAGGVGEVFVVMLYVADAWFAANDLLPPLASGFRHLPALAAAAANLSSLAEVERWLCRALPVVAANPPPGPPARAPTPAARQILGAFQAAVDAGPLSIGELAAHCAISRERLHRVIRRWTGMSPSTYLRALRVHKAREMLFAGDSLAIIAAACGFADQAHFTRAFRQSFGYTPGDLLAAAR